MRRPEQIDWRYLHIGFAGFFGGICPVAIDLAGTLLNGHDVANPAGMAVGSLIYGLVGGAFTFFSKETRMHVAVMVGITIPSVVYNIRTQSEKGISANLDKKHASVLVFSITAYAEDLDRENARKKYKSTLGEENERLKLQINELEKQIETARTEAVKAEPEKTFAINIINYFPSVKAEVFYSDGEHIIFPMMSSMQQIPSRGGVTLIRLYGPRFEEKILDVSPGTNGAKIYLERPFIGGILDALGFIGSGFTAAKVEMIQVESKNHQ